jgi:hypothetical protein
MPAPPSFLSARVIIAYICSIHLTYISGRQECLSCIYFTPFLLPPKTINAMRIGLKNGGASICVLTTAAIFLNIKMPDFERFCCEVFSGLPRFPALAFSIDILPKALLATALLMLAGWNISQRKISRHFKAGIIWSTISLATLVAIVYWYSFMLMLCASFYEPHLRCL